MPIRTPPDAREVDRFEALVTVDDADRAPEWLYRCVPGSTWTAQIRTAEVAATVVARNPLGTFEERVCTCLSLRLALPVPVEPGLRFRIVADDATGLVASGVVRPWAADQSGRLVPAAIAGQPGLGQGAIGEGLEPRKEEVAAPVLVLDGVQRREVGLFEAIGQDRVRLGHAQLDDRGQPHDRPARRTGP